ncbi:MAG: class I SAM-dependent methyltransferase [Chloroflexi bacterium]|nr:class I SAM-dependent methyltransferase [Chloroflexota bacterium]
MNPKERVRDGFDAVSYVYRADDADDGPYGVWLEELAPRLPRGGSVLDLGCGCGVPAARWLVRHGYMVTGIDLSPVQIERARRLVPDADFRCADITAVDFPDGTFDAVVSFYAIIHVPIDEQPALFGAMHRWLKPGCWLLATVGARPWTGSEDNWLGAGATMYWSHEGTETYLRWAREAGFEVTWHRFIPEGSGGHTLVLARV